MPKTRHPAPTSMARSGPCVSPPVAPWASRPGYSFGSLGHWLVEVKTGGAIEGDRRWIWRTYQEWAEEFGWWEWWEIRDRVLPAIPEGVVLRKGAWRNGRKTTLYSLDFHHLDRLIRSRWAGPAEMGRPGDRP